MVRPPPWSGRGGRGWRIIILLAAIGHYLRIAWDDLTVTAWSDRTARGRAGPGAAPGPASGPALAQALLAGWAEAWRAGGAAGEGTAIMLHYTAMRLTSEVRGISDRLPGRPGRDGCRGRRRRGSELADARS